MGCCKSSEADAVVHDIQPNRDQSLLKSEHIPVSPPGNPMMIRSSPPTDPGDHASVPAAATPAKPPPPPIAPVNSTRSSSALVPVEQNIATPDAPNHTVPFQSSQIPFKNSPMVDTSQPRTPAAFSAAMLLAKSPDTNSVASWEGEAGAGIWRMCDGDGSPNVLASIVEERMADEEDARAAMKALQQDKAGDSPFFRSVSSKETTPAGAGTVREGSPLLEPSPGVLTGIMREKAANGGAMAKNPMLTADEMSPPMGDDSPLFRSVSSVSYSETPSKSAWHENNPQSLGFDIDKEAAEWLAEGPRGQSKEHNIPLPLRI